MLLRIPAVLTATQIDEVNTLLAGAEFVDGRLSAGAAAQRVKRNQELSPHARQVEQLNGIVMTALVNHPTYKSAALPHRVATPFYARYGQGMGYGEHVDDPVMGPGPRYRADIAVTLFLSAPEVYDGGELVVRTEFGDQSVKLPAGDAILYPASSLHRVTEVTSGARLAAVTWVQSLVREPAKRELLYDLHLARERLLQDAPDAPETARIGRVYVNLVRMWAET
ncbi:MAG: Fe2+-dependent dioxygenase [Chromatiales bacterium 21-64-14]|nr:MAG: Fe2+-dependent dioxygenase [Chromatiales bacterium 21-64-14]HQU15628.1 Fe2+-dependent dioxygenase [Gammaproteobacteria bacterium]